MISSVIKKLNYKLTRRIISSLNVFKVSKLHLKNKLGRGPFAAEVHVACFWITMQIMIIFVAK